MNCLEIASFERREKNKKKKKKRNFEDRLISRELYNLEQTQKVKRRRIFRATLSLMD